MQLETNNSTIQFLKVEDIKEILGVSRTSAYSLVNSGEFPVLKVGKSTIRIPKDSFLSWVNNHMTNPCREGLADVQ